MLVGQGAVRRPVFNEAGDAILMRLYPTVAKMSEIKAALLEIGMSPSSDQVSARARRLELKRPEEYFAGGLPVPGQQPTQAKPRCDPGPRLLANLDVVIAWASGAGLTVKDWDDLRTVNAVAERLGHPGFRRELPVHRSARRWGARAVGAKKFNTGEGSHAA